jgi:hypothetical protein
MQPTRVSKVVRVGALLVALALLSSSLLFTDSRAASYPFTVYLPLAHGPQPPAPAPTAPPAPTPTTAPAGQIVARGFTGYYDLGDHFSFGEVINHLDVPIYNVELLITYRNAAGAVVATDEASAILERIEARSSSPIENIYFNAPSGITRIEGAITAWARTSSINYQPVTILSTEQTIGPGSGGPVLEGQGRNDTGQPMSRVLLVASFRDAAGNVVNVFYDYPVQSSLQPGQTFNYRIETLDSTLADTTGLVQGRGVIQ